MYNNYNVWNNVFLFLSSLFLKGFFFTRSLYFLCFCFLNVTRDRVLFLDSSSGTAMNHQRLRFFCFSFTQAKDTTVATILKV